MLISQNKQLKGNRFYKLGLLFLITSLVVVLAGCGAGGEDEDAAKQTEDPTQTGEGPEPIVIELGVDDNEVIATYEGGEVTGGELEKYLQVQAFLYPQYAPMIQASDTEAMEEFLKRYIAEKALAAKSNTDSKEAEQKADEMVSQFLEQYASYLGEDEVKNTMEKQQINEEDLKNYVIRNNHVESYLRTTVTEEKEEEVYNEKKENGDFTIASVRHILISNEERSDEEAKQLADKILDRLKQGEDFAELAKEYSDDPGSVENGGLYEDARVSDWVPEFKQAAAELEIGKISDPVKTDYGYHVMKVEERKVLTLQEVLDESRDEIDLEVMNQTYELFVTEDLDKLIKDLNVPEIKTA